MGVLLPIMMTRLFLRLSLLGFLLFLGSCSSAFHREWRAAQKAGPKTGVEGAWQGSWQSSVNGHHGQLRCVVGPVKNAQGDHDFHYHATWKGILSGAYRAEHRVKVSRQEQTFTGTHDMPTWAGGRYTYGGTVTGDVFKACYGSSADRGTFEMQRVKQPAKLD